MHEEKSRRPKDHSNPRRGHPESTFWLDGVRFEGLPRIREELGLFPPKIKSRETRFKKILLIGYGYFEGHRLCKVSEATDAWEFAERKRLVEKEYSRRQKHPLGSPLLSRVVTVPNQLVY